MEKDYEELESSNSISLNETSQFILDAHLDSYIITCVEKIIKSWGGKDGERKDGINRAVESFCVMLTCSKEESQEYLNEIFEGKTNNNSVIAKNIFKEISIYSTGNINKLSAEFRQCVAVSDLSTDVLAHQIGFYIKEKIEDHLKENYKSFYEEALSLGESEEIDIVPSGRVNPDSESRLSPSIGKGL